MKLSLIHSSFVALRIKLLTEGLILEAVSSNDANEAYDRFLESGDMNDFGVFYSYFIDRKDMIERKMKLSYGDYAIETVDYESAIQDTAEYFFRAKKDFGNNVAYFWRLIRLRIIRLMDKHNKTTKGHGDATRDDFPGAQFEPGSNEDFLNQSPARLFDIIDQFTMDYQPRSQDVRRGFYVYGGRKIEIDNSLLTPREAKALKLSLGGVGKRQKYRSNPYSDKAHDSGTITGMGFREIGQELGGVSGVAVKNIIDKAKEKLAQHLHSTDISQVGVADY